MTVRAWQFLAIILTTLALVPTGAHVLELLNKIDLDRDSYVTVQQIHRGWALSGSVLIASLLANGFVAVRTKSQMIPMAFASAAALLMAVVLVVFFAWTYPVNQATSNWTVAPDNWQALRAQWEYSHAANAAVTFSALCASIAAGLSSARNNPASLPCPHEGILSAARTEE